MERLRYGRKYATRFDILLKGRPFFLLGPCTQHHLATDSFTCLLHRAIAPEDGHRYFRVVASARHITTELTDRALL